MSLKELDVFVLYPFPGPTISLSYSVALIVRSLAHILSTAIVSELTFSLWNKAAPEQQKRQTLRILFSCSCFPSFVTVSWVSTSLLCRLVCVDHYSSPVMVSSRERSTRLCLLLPALQPCSCTIPFLRLHSCTLAVEK